MRFTLFLNISYAIIDFLYVFAIHIFFKKTLGKPKRKKLVPIVYGGYIICDCLIYFFVDNSVIIMFTAILFLFLCSLIYGKFGWHNIAITLVYYAISTAVELFASSFVMLMFHFSHGVENETKLLLVYILDRILIFLVMIIIKHLGKNSFKNSFPITINSIGIIGIVLASIWLVYYIYVDTGFSPEELSKSKSIPLLITMMVIVGIDIVAFYLFSKQEERYVMESENLALKNTVEMQRMQFDSEERYRMNISRINHDMKNYLIAINTYVQKGDLKSIKEAINDKVVELDNVQEVSASGWMPIDTVINYKASYASEKRINITVTSGLEDVPTVSAEDICVLVGNALDNAIEYLEGHPELDRDISVAFANDEAGFFIQIQNPVKERIKIINGEYVKSTKSGEGHGYGLLAAKAIADKYEGDIILECDENIFSFGAVLH